MAFFLTISMRCFCLTVTYIHIINITLEVRIPSVCPTAGQMQGNFHFVFKGPKYLIPLALNASSTGLFNSKRKSFFLGISKL